MDQFLVKSLNPKYPLGCHKCAEKYNFSFTGPWHHLKSVSPPQKMVPSCSLVICPPKTSSLVNHWLLLYWENFDFLKAPNFGKSTQMSLELPKVWQKKFQWEVSQIVDNRFPCPILCIGTTCSFTFSKDLRRCFIKVHVLLFQILCSFFNFGACFKKAFLLFQRNAFIHKFLDINE